MKCYNVTITGKVQDIGFRSVIEHAGRLLDLSGLVFNARNGSVQILCRGEDGDIRDFSQEIMVWGVKSGAVIQNIIRQELPIDIDLPYPFSRVLADDDVDLGRKLDRGIEILKDIKGDTSAISVGIDTLNMKFDSFIHGQEEHNLHLEKILEKLAEK